ncbi:M28 family metallopeptidase [Actinoplanes sp. NPDC051633]|uniref:M28 family metallopeptidase n=1 Tax=Actinoplanes sp. NPDC051633 TaxID=3155670 RepID=UPI003442D9BB
MRPPLDELLAAVSGERMAATVAALAAESFAGRRVGSAGGAAARAWLGGRLADLGAEVSFEPFGVAAIPEVYAKPSVTWHDGHTVHTLRFGRQVAVHPASAEQPLVRRGALGNAGRTTPSDRWLVVPAGMRLFDAFGHGDGAIGLIIGRDVDGDGWQYTMLAGPGPGPLPVLAVDTDTHAALQSAAERGTGWLAGNTPIRRLDLPAANVHGRWRPGTDLLLTAHYDGVGDLPGLRQPAAADNASGVAVVLETARVLSSALPAGVGLTVALLDAEEAGALGSAHHAAQLRHNAATPMVINVDGAGCLHETVAVEAGGPAHALLAVLDQAGRHTGLPLAAGPVASDNRRYAAAGFAAVGIGAGMAGYHSPADTPDRVETATLTAVARLVVATAWHAAARPHHLTSPPFIFDRSSS